MFLPGNTFTGSKHVVLHLTLTAAPPDSGPRPLLAPSLRSLHQNITKGTLPLKIQFIFIYLESQ